MEQSKLKEEQAVSRTLEDKPVIKGESLLVDNIDYTDVNLTTEQLSVRPVPDDIRAFLETIPDTDMFKVEEMKQKYMRSFDMTEEQYNRIAEEMLEEGYVLK